ncbi:MAG: HAMP domain-containing protein [Nitrospinae bacterium]|nr:HAMP domain-containing protein [Nitrospinota bacterium]
MPLGLEIARRWFFLLFKKRLSISFFVIIPLVLGLTAFASGFIALVLVENFLLKGGVPSSALGRAPVLEVLGYIRFEVLAFTVLGIFAGVGIAYAILNPLRKIMEGARQIAHGDFSGQLDIENLDELGILGKDFNTMVSSLNKHFIDSMAGGWILLNKSGEIVSINPGAVNILGRQAEDLIGKPLEELFRGLRSDKNLNRLLSDALNGKTVSPTQEIEVITRDNRKTTLSLSTTLLKDKDDLFVGIAATIKDLNRARQLTEQIQRTDKLASLGGMAAALAHEIRNPLGSIKGLTQLLDEEFSEGERGRKYTRTMIREIDRLNEVVTHLLNFSQSAPARLEECDVNMLLGQALEVALININKREARVNKQLASDLPVIWAEGKKLVQAFLNLLINASQAVERGGEIRLTTRFEENSGDPEPAGQVVVTIENSGDGIDPAHAAHIFDPFFTTKKEGTGLGLAITHQIVTMHNGTIEVTQKDKLTVFTVTLPTMKPSPSDAAKAGGRKSSASVSEP